jgi:DNA-binding NarL/FixJ family response regulator
VPHAPVRWCAKKRVPRALFFSTTVPWQEGILRCRPVRLASLSACTLSRFPAQAHTNGIGATARESELLQTSEIEVLIAHRDPLISAGLAAVLSKRAFRVLTLRADESVAVRAGTRSVTTDVVVADYESGLRLTESGYEQRDRIMILTHVDSEANVCYALEQGVRGHLLLGCSLEVLIGGIRSVHGGGIAVAPLVARRMAERMKREALTVRQVLRHLIQGLSNKKIAAALCCREETVKTHVKSILAKLGAASRTAAVAIAHHRGILREDGEPPVSQQRSQCGNSPCR